MPKSIHKSAEIHLKTIEHLKELKQIKRKKIGGWLGAGSVLGRRNGAKWTNMDQHGAKRMPTVANMEPKGDQKAKQNVRKTLFRKSRFKERLRTKGVKQKLTCFAKMSPKDTFRTFSKMSENPENPIFE